MEGRLFGLVKIKVMKNHSLVSLVSDSVFNSAIENMADIEPLTITLGDWRQIMKAITYLTMSLQYLEDHSMVLWGDLRQNRNLDELITGIKGIL